jgi:hypothetical protein
MFIFAYFIKAVEEASPRGVTRSNKNRIISPSD